MATGAHEPRDGESDARQLQSARAARLMDLLGLSEDELCRILAVDPLTLLSGQIEHRAELGILLTLLDDAGQQASPALLARWLRTQGPAGRPLDALLARDFAAFEDALVKLADRGFVIRAGGGGG
jgi:hypothetical protein